MVHVYNLLPPEYDEKECVSDFRKALRSLILKASQKGDEVAEDVLSAAAKPLPPDEKLPPGRVVPKWTVRDLDRVWP